MRRIARDRGPHPPRHYPGNKEIAGEGIGRAPFKGGRGGVQPSPPPAPGGAEFLEAPKAPKKFCGLN